MQETTLSPQHLIMPYFVTAGREVRESLKTMPGLFRFSGDQLLKELKMALSLGIKSIALFPRIEDKLKSATADEAYNENGLIPELIKKIKDRFPELVIVTDVALDPYSTEGHDGLVKNGEILNDETIEVLEKMALCQALAGADIVAPSDMMDGRVGALRRALDQNGFTQTSIMAYSAKYASAFYGPFREALDSAPKLGDKKTYQMDPANRREALRELKLDLQEGADIVMVKPALSYLDIISDFKQKSDVPVAAYNVSGEYAMVKFAAQAGALDEKKVRDELLISMRRAGADMILSYFSVEYAQDYN